MIPKKHMEYNFSLPKRKPKKQLQNQDVNKEHQKVEINQNDMANYNNNENLNNEEDFWVDCKNQIENKLNLEGVNNQEYPNFQHNSNQNLLNNYNNQSQNFNNYYNDNTPEDNEQIENFPYNQKNQFSNQDAQNKGNREFNSKFNEDDSNYKNIGQNMIHSSVKKPEEGKEGNNYNDNLYRQDLRNKENYLGIGAYGKSKDLNEIEDSLNDDNDGKKNRSSLASNRKESRYLQETLSSRNLKRIYSSQEKDMTPRKSQEEIEVDQKKKKSAAEKCFSLYENGKIKNEVNRILAEKNEKIKRELELKECTFFPKTNFNEKYIGDKNVNNQMLKKLDSNFYERILNWQQKKEKKSQKEKSSLNDIEKYTHVPKINKKNLEVVFDDTNSIYKDFYSKNHIIRLDNARREVEDKQKRLQWNSKNNNNTAGKHMRSSSMESINPELYMNLKNDPNNALNNLKKNLRDELNSMMINHDSDGEF